MLIQGKPVTTNDFQSILDQIAHLPSKLERTGIDEDSVLLDGSLVPYASHLDFALDSSRPELSSRTKTMSLTAIDMARRSHNHQPLASISSKYGQLLQKTGDLNSAAPYFEEAFHYAKAEGLNNLAHQAALGFYTVCMHQLSRKKIDFASVEKSLTQCITYFEETSIYGRQKEKHDPDAYSLGQRE
ncbi:MAG: hypothetical protein AB7E52_02045, partial [Bdellovibrionales bacterium]